MKNYYPEYYYPSPSDFRDDLEVCDFVLDTNILLDFARLRIDVLTKVLELLKIDFLKGRLFIPRHVLYEFHRHIYDADSFSARNMQVFRHKIEALLSKDTLLPEAVKIYFSQEEIDKCSNVLAESQNSILEIVKEKESKFFLNLRSQNIARKIFETLGDEMLLKENTEEVLNKRKEEALRRMEERIPPGYKDNIKEDNREGDYLIWAEILDLVKARHKSVVFVSGDLKEDWVHYDKETGIEIGPRIELRKEFMQADNQNSNLFYMNLFEFLSLLNGKHAILSQDEMSEIKNAKKWESEISNWYNLKEKAFSGNAKSKKNTMPESNKLMSKTN